MLALVCAVNDAKTSLVDLQGPEKNKGAIYSKLEHVATIQN